MQTLSGVEAKVLKLISLQVIKAEDIIGKESEFLQAYQLAETASLKEFLKQMVEKNDYHINTIDEVFIEKFKAEFNK